MLLSLSWLCFSLSLSLFCYSLLSLAQPCLFALISPCYGFLIVCHHFVSLCCKSSWIVCQFISFEVSSSLCPCQRLFHVVPLPARSLLIISVPAMSLLDKSHSRCISPSYLFPCYNSLYFCFNFFFLIVMSRLLSPTLCLSFFFNLYPCCLFLLFLFLPLTL